MPSADSASRNDRVARVIICPLPDRVPADARDHRHAKSSTIGTSMPLLWSLHAKSPDLPLNRSGRAPALIPAAWAVMCPRS